MRNSSYSFIPILLKLYRYLDHPLKICMWFDVIVSLILITFSQLELSRVSGVYTEKINAVWIYVILSKYICVAGDINSLYFSKKIYREYKI